MEKRLRKPLTDDEFVNLAADIILLKPNRTKEYIAIWCDYLNSVCKGIVVKATSRASREIQIIVNSGGKLTLWKRGNAALSDSIEVGSLLLVKNKLPTLTKSDGWQESDLEVVVEE